MEDCARPDSAYKREAQEQAREKWSEVMKLVKFSSSATDDNLPIFINPDQVEAVTANADSATIRLASGAKHYVDGSASKVADALQEKRNPGVA